MKRKGSLRTVKRIAMGAEGIVIRKEGIAMRSKLELELELIQTQMAQKPMLRAEVGMRVRCANKASAE